MRFLCPEISPRTCPNNPFFHCLCRSLVWSSGEWFFGVGLTAAAAVGCFSSWLINTLTHLQTKAAGDLAGVAGVALPRSIHLSTHPAGRDRTCWTGQQGTMAPLSPRDLQDLFWAAFPSATLACLSYLSHRQFQTGRKCLPGGVGRGGCLCLGFPPPQTPIFIFLFRLRKK